MTNPGFNPGFVKKVSNDRIGGPFHYGKIYKQRFNDVFFCASVCSVTTKKLKLSDGVFVKISIIIPAHNEETRIERTLIEYASFFEQKKVEHEFIVVLNGCTDNTLEIVKAVQKNYASIRIIDLPQAGKGLAVAAGFRDALIRDNDFIGFVDADMATQPQYFYDLIENIGKYDGIIASRYMKESKIYPPRPWIKEWGRILFYNPLTRLLFGMNYKDFQCGAKLFKRKVIEKIITELKDGQWAFDVELLYLCKKHGFVIKELPTVWYDQGDSKFSLHAGIGMFFSLFKLRFTQ